MFGPEGRRWGVATDVDGVRRSVRRTLALVERPTEPAGARVFGDVPPGAVPDGHALEMRFTWVGVTHPLDDGKPALVQQPGGVSKRTMQSHEFVDPNET